MITATDIFQSERLYDLESELKKRFPDKKVAYFDIETTGFSSKSQQIYMIGAAFQNETDNTFTIMQWFDDTSHDECKLLLVFREFLKDFDILIDYNGSSFDVPFIENRGIRHGILFHFDRFICIDIYKEIRKYKNFFKTPDLKQKSIEFFLGIEREDEYDGGRLIEIYQDYLKGNSKDETLYSLLMLHNHDDIIGLVNICDILAYLEFLNGKFTLQSARYEETSLILGFQLDFVLRQPVFESLNGISLDVQDNTFHIMIPVVKGEMKYFYENYKDYFYLPQEDTAIHKSVAQFVDKTHRQKATKQNCYIKKNSTFVLEYSDIFKPAFRQNASDKHFYFEITQENVETLDKERMRCYVQELLHYLIKQL